MGPRQCDGDLGVRGAPAAGRRAGRDVRRLLEGVAASGELVGPEYDMVEAYMGVIDEGIAAGDLEEIEGWEGYKLAIIYNVLFELSAAHPGPIPPPFPE